MLLMLHPVTRLSGGEFCEVSNTKGILMSSNDNPTEGVQPAPIVEIGVSDKLAVSIAESASWMKSQRIETALEYWERIVKPDYEEICLQITDLRRAFHCAVSLFHLSDWLYVEHKAQINKEFTFKDVKGKVKQVSDEKEFANALAQLYPDFDLVRGIANAAKHLKLRPKTSSHPAAPSHAANVSIQVTGYGQGGFGQGPYGGAPRVMLAGPSGNDLEFSALATSTVEMWKKLSQHYDWRLT